MDTLIAGRTQAQIDAVTHCEVCGQAFPPKPHCEVCKQAFPSIGASGYGIRAADGKKVCYICCADDDLAAMKANGRITLYLEEVKTDNLRTIGYNRGRRYLNHGCYQVSNWPGTLKFRPHQVMQGRHNIAGRRYDVWFKDGDNNLWWGVQYGDSTMILHCKRIKSTR